MADNVDLPATSVKAAADEATYSGDTTKIQLIRFVHVTGAEGAKTVSELVKLEDDPHTSGDAGLMLLGVRNDAAATRTSTDGDYSPISLSPEGHVDVEVRRDLLRVATSVTGVTTATTAYTAGDTVGTLYTLANAARASGGGGTITGVTLIDQSDIIGAYDVVFFDSSITLAADNAAFAISDADSLKFVGLVQLAGAIDLGNNRVAQAYNLAVPYVCSGGTSLYAALITRVGHTFFTSGALPQLNVYMERN